MLRNQRNSSTTNATNTTNTNQYKADTRTRKITNGRYFRVYLSLWFGFDLGVGVGGGLVSFVSYSWRVDVACVGLSNATGEREREREWARERRTRSTNKSTPNVFECVCACGVLFCCPMADRKNPAERNRECSCGGVGVVEMVGGKWVVVVVLNRVRQREKSSIYIFGSMSKNRSESRVRQRARVESMQKRRQIVS